MTGTRTSSSMEAFDQKQDGMDKDKPKGCCSGFCCKCIGWTVLVLVILLLILGILVLIYFPKAPKLKFISMDTNKSVVYEIESQNAYDVKVNKLFGDITFKNIKLADFNADNIVIKAKDRTKVELLLSNVNMAPEAVKHCATSSNLPAQINMNIHLAFMGIKRKHTESASVPCPSVPKTVAGLSDKEIGDLMAKYG